MHSLCGVSRWLHAFTFFSAFHSFLFPFFSPLLRHEKKKFASTTTQAVLSNKKKKKKDLNAHRIKEIVDQ